MKISVVLPVYNVEEFIEDCLLSLLNQSIGEKNLEIILIDDCSTDNTFEKIKKFQNKFTNIIYHRLNENQGSPGKPRNIGVEISSGDYLHFMDPDDVLEEDAYETLLNFMCENDDFAMGKMLSFNEDGTHFEHVTFKEYKLNKTYKSTNIIETPFFAQVKVGVVLKLIKKEFYINNNISFIENMKNGEDKIVDTLLYTRAKSFSYIPYVIYKYRNRDSGENKSLTHQEVKASIYNDIDAFYTSEKFYNKEILEFFKINVMRSIFWKILDYDFEYLNYEEKIDIFQQINKILGEYDESIMILYLKNEEPIVKLIKQHEYELALSYASLLTARRNYFYKGIDIEQRFKEFENFRHSKSYKMYKFMKLLKLNK
ncbi:MULTISPECIES: glycosyltransferase family 2 protein [unclassified Mammaliicoccus]|uniref:glycosyltransferase family 2 protein n=1 Tax=unclassified Mammaliicoccus TaxID=2803851 RepID=UPI001EFC0E08|nr:MULTISPECIES: glycosyltransferase family 2 protein [unclassified Mammaliicoccus]